MICRWIKLREQVQWFERVTQLEAMFTFGQRRAQLGREGTRRMISVECVVSAPARALPSSVQQSRCHRHAREDFRTTCVWLAPRCGREDELTVFAFVLARQKFTSGRRAVYLISLPKFVRGSR